MKSMWHWDQRSWEKPSFFLICTYFKNFYVISLATLIQWSWSKRNNFTGEQRTGKRNLNVWTVNACQMLEHEWFSKTLNALKRNFYYESRFNLWQTNLAVRSSRFNLGLLLQVSSKKKIQILLNLGHVQSLQKFFTQAQIRDGIQFLKQNKNKWYMH